MRAAEPGSWDGPHLDVLALLMGRGAAFYAADKVRGQLHVPGWQVAALAP